MRSQSGRAELVVALTAIFTDPRGDLDVGFWVYAIVITDLVLFHPKAEEQEMSISFFPLELK